MQLLLYPFSLPTWRRVECSRNIPVSLWFYQVLSGALPQYLSLGVRCIRVGECTYSLNTCAQSQAATEVATVAGIVSLSTNAALLPRTARAWTATTETTVARRGNKRQTLL